MPTYRYVCDKCDQEFDVEQSITNPALTTHPNCGGKVHKVFGAVGIVFKGSGFHKTDSRPKPPPEKPAKPKPSESKNPEKKSNSVGDS